MMQKETILVVAAHPDDEVLGCGATLARHAANGSIVHTLILSEGATARSLKHDRGEYKHELDQLRDAAHRAADIIGSQTPRMLSFPDNRMDSISILEITKAVEEVIAELKPTIIYTHHGGDLNRDHQITHEAVVTAARFLPGNAIRAIHTFETVSSTEWSSPTLHSAFQPNRFVDVSDFLPKKLEALSCYDSEMRAFPHPRSHDAIKALAASRGSACGVKAAEAFQLVRELV